MPLSSLKRSRVPNPSLTRRSFTRLAGLGGAAVLAKPGLAAGMSAANTRPAAHVDVLAQTPEERAAAFMRLSAGIGKTSVFTNEGIIYGKVPGRLPLPLFGYVTILEIRCEVLGPASFSTVQKEAMVCIDPSIRLRLTSWTNPFTGKTLVPIGYVSPDNRYYFSAEGSYMRSPLPDDVTQRRKAALAIPQQSWHASTHDIWVTERRYNRFASAINKDEFPEAFAGDVRESVDILTYRGKLRDFSDPSRPSIPSTITMMADTPWPLWMFMGTRPGGTVWHGFGTKYQTLSDVSGHVRAPVDAAYPGFMDDPWGFPSEDYGTAVQMRRLRAEGRI